MTFGTWVQLEKGWWQSQGTQEERFISSGSFFVWSELEICLSVIQQTLAVCKALPGEGDLS